MVEIGKCKYRIKSVNYKIYKQYGLNLQQEHMTALATNVGAMKMMKSGSFKTKKDARVRLNPNVDQTRGIT